VSLNSNGGVRSVAAYTFRTGSNFVVVSTYGNGWDLAYRCLCFVICCCVWTALYMNTLIFKFFEVT
jgi:hypothetical protein